MIVHRARCDISSGSITWKFIDEKRKIVLKSKRITHEILYSTNEIECIDFQSVVNANNVKVFLGIFQ